MVIPYQHHIIEILSPVLQKGFGGNPILDDLNFEDVSKVANIIQTHFRAFCNNPPAYMSTSATAPDAVSNEISTMQKLVVYLWTFEPVVGRSSSGKGSLVSELNVKFSSLISGVAWLFEVGIDAFFSYSFVRKLQKPSNGGLLF